MKDSVHVSGKKEELNPSPVTSKIKTVFLHVNSFVPNVHSVTGLPQKKGVNPNYCCNQTEIKHVNDVSCVGHLSSANIVTNVPTVAINPPIGARLHQFWEKWEALGSSPKVVTALREGYTLPFRFRLNLTRSPNVNPQRQSHLLEVLCQLVNKNAVELVANQNSPGFYNQLFLVPKPNNRWRPVLDLSTLGVGHVPTSRTHISIYQFTVSPGSTCVFTSRVSPTSSKPYPVTCPQHPWSSQWWPKRSN